MLPEAGKQVTTHTSSAPSEYNTASTVLFLFELMVALLVDVDT
jgi:hypothetical protein